MSNDPSDSPDLFRTPDAPPEAPRSPGREAMRPALPKRFYKQAAVEEGEGGFALTLDSRPARTPARRPLQVPTRALGEALAQEWQDQGAEIDPAAMPITRIVNSTLDGVAVDPGSVLDDLVRYAGSDLVCYRADDPPRLVAAQAAAWDPVLAWARATLGARFILSEGVMYAAQPDHAVAAVRAHLEVNPDPFRLASLHVMTTLTGSVLIALAHAAGQRDASSAWEAAHVDERFQEQVWGEDLEAMQRRQRRFAEFEAASRVYALAVGA